MNFNDLGGEFFSSPDVENLLKSRYFLKNEKTWDDVAKRVSCILPEIYPYIRDQYFCPSTPTLFNLNTKGERNGTLSSCFTMGIEDSIEGIFDALKECAVVTKAAGGVGYVFDLRSRNEIIKSLNRDSSGPLPFIKIFNSVLDGISQAGARKGAGMAQLRIDHPEILYFIDAKKDYKNQDFARFNFSIRVPDWFYKKLDEEPDSVMMVRNVVDGKQIELEENGKKVTVGELWNRIIHNSWLSAEPGLFHDSIAFDRSTVTNLNETISSNPCSEFISIPYASCNLASINLVKFVKSFKDETGVIHSFFDFEAFEKLIELATIYLNKIIDNNKFPLKKIEEVTKKTRPIGLGFMGLAHALYLLEIPFASPEGSQFIDNVSNILTLKSLETSVELAKKEGAYPAYDEFLFLKANERIFTKNKRGEDLKKAIIKYGIRNHATTSIAPTGSISFLFVCSSGLEPVYSLAFIRKIEKLNKKYEEVYIADRFFDRYLDVYYPKDKEKILKNVVDNDGSCQKCDILSNKEKAIFITAKDMTPMQHLESLAIASNNIGFSISKTINLPKTATEEEVGEVYRKAHKMGCIGVTVYRDGCREGILVSANKEEPASKLPRTKAPKRPEFLRAELHHFLASGKKYYACVGFFGDQTQPFEIFVGINETRNKIFIPKSIKVGKIQKKGSGKYSFIGDDGEEYELLNGHSDDTIEALTRLLSLSLRHGVPLHFAIEQLQKANGPVTTFTKILFRALKRYVPDNTVSSATCPECGEKLIYAESCKKCPACGFSHCN